MTPNQTTQPPDKSVTKIDFLIFQPNHVVGIQKNPLIVPILLSTLNTHLSKLMDKKINHNFRQKK